MNLQTILVLMSILLVIMLGLLIFVIRLALKKDRPVKSPEVISPFLNQSQQITKPKYANSKLPSSEKKRYSKKIIEVLEIKKIYQQPDLTIKNLAIELDLPRHHLSQIINEQLGTNFIDLINRYRVAAAKEKLQDKTLQALSILSIGKQVGFHSKSTFYAAFKKYTNQTPAAFRKAAKRKQAIN